MAPKTAITSAKMTAPKATRRPAQRSCPTGHVARVEGREDHGHVGLQPADAGHDRVGRFEGRGLHRLRREEPRRQEGEVADARDALRVRVVHEGAQADAHGHQEEDRAEEVGEDGAPPGPSVDQDLVLHDAQHGARAPRPPRSLGEAPPGESQEDVLQRRAPHELADRADAHGVDGLGRRLAVSGVEEQPVGQVLDALDEPVESAGEVGRRAVVEAELEDLAAAVRIR